MIRDSTNEDHDNDSGGAQVKFLNRLTATCDLIMGFSIEAAVQHPPDCMSTTLVYIKTGFVIVTKR